MVQHNYHSLALLRAQCANSCSEKAAGSCALPLFVESAANDRFPPSTSVTRRL